MYTLSNSRKHPESLRKSRIFSIIIIESERNRSHTHLNQLYQSNTNDTYQ